MANKELMAKLVLRSDTAANFMAANPVLLKGECAFESDTYKVKIGDGVEAYTALAYFKGDIDYILDTFLDRSTYAANKEGYVKAAVQADKLTNAVSINGVSFNGTQNITVEDDTKISNSEKGVANGVATLGADGLVKSEQLPSYVDEGIEGYYHDGKFYTESDHTTEIVGEEGKIYVDITSSADDKTNIYRFSGSAYISISNPLDIATESEAKAYTNNTKAMTPLRTKQAIDNAEISTSKLYVPAGDRLIINGGNASA